MYTHTVTPQTVWRGLPINAGAAVIYPKRRWRSCPMLNLVNESTVTTYIAKNLVTSNCESNHSRTRHKCNLACPCEWGGLVNQSMAAIINTNAFVSISPSGSSAPLARFTLLKSKMCTHSDSPDCMARLANEGCRAIAAWDEWFESRRDSDATQMRN